MDKIDPVPTEAALSCVFAVPNCVLTATGGTHQPCSEPKRQSHHLRKRRPYPSCRRFYTGFLISAPEGAAIHAYYQLHHSDKRPEMERKTKPFVRETGSYVNI